MKPKKTNQSNSGFTLLEILVVITIIGFLTAMGMTSYNVTQQRGRDARRKGDISAIQNAFEQYYVVHNSTYPKEENEAKTSLQSGSLPVDPKTGAPYSYTYDATNGSTYCACATLEVLGGGNATAVGKADGTCNFGTSTSAAPCATDATCPPTTSADFFCVQARQ